MTGPSENLADAMRAVLPNIFATTNPELGEKLRDEWVDAILDMPEMQAIRLALHNVGVRVAAGVDARWELIWNDLPDNVKRWVR